MNNNQVSNPKVEVPTGISMNDQDYITSLLTCLKDMAKNYVIAMTEASCENLYEKHKQAFERISQLQRDVYETMFRFGWYSLETAESQKISSKYQMLNQKYQDLNIS